MSHSPGADGKAGRLSGVGCDDDSGIADADVSADWKASDDNALSDFKVTEDFMTTA